MNHLAHALLAGDDADLRLGGMLGDFVHGKPDPQRFPPRVIDGIRLHRAIDVYTDAHPEVAEARRLLPSPYRRFGGILLDMWFDHLLARDFASWSAEPLDVYSDQLRALLHRHRELLPEGLQRFLAYMEVHGLPAGYAERGEIERALRGVSARLSRANPVGDAMPVLLELEQPLHERFEAFFPQLRAFAADWIANGEASELR
ncbi:ACP phosphodiesterase [Dyella sp. 2RAB6]|uniref:acyl carrier protein phosphodiesterase n=1 Tax=Dyella sp. 2RAB6 TaxID=3232992 RepID=UPI003F8DDB10